MSATWVIADTHHGHTKTWETFKREDGSPLRPFTSTEEMDETMVARWNDRVRPSDRVYHLGDVVIQRRNLSILSRLNGRKRLIRGNHDVFKTADYLKYFDEIDAYRFLDDVVLSHIPIHPDSLRRPTNVHGHLHAGRVTFNRVGDDLTVSKIVDPRYLCVSVEHTDYAPISFERVRELIQRQNGAVT